MTRSLLLEAGLETFHEKGYGAATIDEVATRAGANRATFYLHFSSKAQLMRALIEQINDTVVSSDRPRLTQVVASGNREQIRAWLARRFDQWAEIMPYVVAAYQASDTDAEIAAAVEAWLESAIAEIHEGLDLADRFEATTRRARSVLAFGQVEFLSRRWAHAGGWTEATTRETALETLTDSWCHLLT